MAATILSAVHLLLRDGDALLMSRRYNTGYHDGNYSVVAGHIEPGETPRQAMRREAREEVGIEIEADSLDFAHVMYRRKANDTTRVDFFFLCTHWDGDIENGEPHKCDDLTWRLPDNRPINTVPYVTAALAHIDKGLPFSEFDDDTLSRATPPTARV